MDFHKLISTAQQNVQTGVKKDNKYYSTNFAPPKKPPKDKKLSAGIQRFLEQKKKEDEEKAEEARRKKAALLASRDEKQTRKIEKSLKSMKSSKKFHTGDKVLDENTAITLENQQPDEDDYGYVSSFSDIYHKQLMEKYANMPDKKFSSSLKRSVMTNEDAQRVKNSLKTKEEEHQVRQVRKSNGKFETPMPSGSWGSEKKVDKPKPIFKPAPIVDFQALLKLAEQKQHEDIQIEVPSAKKKEERLLTSKEKREQEELEAARRARLNRNKIAKVNDRNNNNNNNNNVVNDKKAIPSKVVTNQKTKVSTVNKVEKSQTTNPLKPPSKPANIPSRKSNESMKSSTSKSNDSEKMRNGQRPTTSAIKAKPSTSQSSKVPEKTREFPPKTAPQKSRDFPPKDLMRSREFPPRDLMRTREFPPRDLKQMKRPMKQPLNVKRRRIEDDDDDSEYDSEMDDFIDDGDVELDYSSEIKKIFGYDKSRYRDEDFDDSEMVSDFRTVMKEESISKKIGRMEDLEDMRREEEELKRKAMRKKMKK